MEGKEVGVKRRVRPRNSHSLLYIMGLYILGLYILGLYIMGLDILGLIQKEKWLYSHLLSLMSLLKQQ